MFPFHENSLSSLDEPMKKLPVRRNLFGTPSSEKQNLDFLAQENRIRSEEAAKKFKEKWNFDIITGTPVENSKIEWKIADSPPSFYTKTYSVKPGKSRPVLSPRRERSSPYTQHSRAYIPPHPLRRGHLLRTPDDEENELDSSLDLTSPSKQNSGSKLGPSSARCSLFGLKSISRSHSVSNSPSSPSSGLNTPNGSFKQQNITDHFPVKKFRCHAKSLPRT